MPYKSDAQRRFMHAQHPEIAARWDAEMKKKKSEGKIKKIDGREVFAKRANDPEFNLKAAAAAYETIMKMDEDEAQEFVYHVVSNVTEELISKNLRTLQGTLNRVAKRRVQEIKKATLRSVRKNQSEDAIAFAQALTVISKAGVRDYHREFDENLHPRNPYTGQFRTKVTHNQTKPVDHRTAKTLGIRGTNSDTYKKLSAKQQAQYQDEYRQLANFLATVNQSTKNPGDSDVILHFRAKGPKGEENPSGQTWYERNNGTRPDPKVLDPKDRTLIGIEARPNTLTLGGAAFGLAGAIGNPGTSFRTNQVIGGIDAVDRQFGSFADSWTAETGGMNSNEKLYRRLSTGSEFVSAVAPPGSKAQLAARFGQFVGDHGSDAEAVFGPHARKAAYRYRGITKTPDQDVVSAYENAVHAEKMSNAADPYRATREGRKANLKAPSQLSNVQMAAARVAAERRVPTFEERGAGRSVLANWLMKESPARPKPGLYNLQLASGNTPPSEGFVIDKDGKITNQAVGYGDDHYLPFNLKHLKSLRGGEYIRTRSVGGPTTEDIYTGLMSGAKQITVVSRSGTFTVTFENDFKGGRRYNDKALRMTKRYENLLDAVQSAQVDRKSVPQDIRDAIRTKVLEEYKGYGTAREINTEIERRVQEFKENPELSDSDEQLAQVIATQRARGRQSRDAEDFMNDAMNYIAEQKEFKFRLNGAGYKAALEALHEQFPYYISVNAIPRIDPERIETEVDRGYVEPGRNRPTYAAAGHFGNAKKSPHVGVGQKFSAAEANFQGGRRGGGGGGTSPSAPQVPGGSLSATGERSSEVKAKIATVKQNASFVAAAQRIQEQVRASVEIPDTDKQAQQALDMSPEDLAKPENQAKFDQFVRRLKDQNIKLNDAAAFSAYDVAAGHVGRAEWSPERAGIWGAKPMAFGGPEYSGDKDARRRALAEIDRKVPMGIVHEKPLSKMNDRELQDEFDALKVMRDHLSVAGAEALSLDDRKELLRDLNVKPGNSLRMLLEKPDRVNKRLEYVHRARALNFGVPDSERDADIVVPSRTVAEVNAAAKGPRAGVEYMIGEFDRAARKLGEHDDADEFYLAAQNLHDELRGVVAQSDAQRLFENNRDLLGRAYRINNNIEDGNA